MYQKVNVPFWTIRKHLVVSIRWFSALLKETRLWENGVGLDGFCCIRKGRLPCRRISFAKCVGAKSVTFGSSYVYVSACQNQRWSNPVLFVCIIFSLLACKTVGRWDFLFILQVWSFPVGKVVISEHFNYHSSGQTSSLITEDLLQKHLPGVLSVFLSLQDIFFRMASFRGSVALFPLNNKQGKRISYCQIGNGIDF